MLAPIIPGDRVAPTKLDDAALRARGVTSRAGDAVPAFAQISEKFGMPPRWMDEAR